MMINSKGVRAAVRQSWMTEAQPVTLEVRIDDEAGVLSTQLPSGTKVALDYSELKTFIEAVEARKREAS